MRLVAGLRPDTLGDLAELRGGMEKREIGEEEGEGRMGKK